jgi:hypothetical protein
VENMTATSQVLQGVLAQLVATAHTVSVNTSERCFEVTFASGEAPIGDLRPVESVSVNGIPLDTPAAAVNLSEGSLTIVDPDRRLIEC